MQKRRRFKQTTSLNDRLASFEQQARDRAEKLPPGPERELMLKKVRQAATASDLNTRLGLRGMER